MVDSQLPTSAPGDHPRIALCLSGGGLRATFFHLGLIRFLRKAELLKNVTQISSVSGGSILAAHLVLNWPAYLGNDDEYAAVENELLTFGARDIRGRIVRRWLFSIVFPILRFFPKLAHRTFLLEEEYSKLFDDARLHHLEASKDGRPALHLLATSFTTGNLCSFSSEGFWIHHDDESRLYRTGILPIALAVASSSAFPPLFPPTAITRKMLDASNEELPYDPEFLTDGGIFDNLGFAKFARVLREKNDAEFDYVILSDASAQLDWDIKGRFARVISRTIRSTDILMQRVADFTIGNLRDSIKAAHIFHLPISRVVLQKEFPQPLIVDFQKKLPRIRTDLNRFTLLEVRMLAHHGYEVAFATLKSLMPRESTTARYTQNLIEEQLSANSLSSIVRLLDKGRSRKIGLFDARDWVSFALYAYLAAIALAGTFPYFYVARQAAQGELFKSSRITVPFLTDRKPDVAGKFTGEREDLHSGWAVVSIPGDHKAGYLELRPTGLGQFLGRATGFFSIDSLRTDPSLRAAPIIRGQRRTLLYVHGYNTSFETAVLRTAQIASDTQYPGASIAYSWPSRATISGYNFDEESAEYSSANFARSLKLIGEADAGKLDVITSGLGARVLINTARQMKPVDGSKLFGELIFLAPDVDRNVFSSAIPDLVQIAERVTLIVLTNDRGLLLSKTLNNSPRAGDAQSPLTAAGLNTLRFGNIGGDTEKEVTVALSLILSRVPIAEMVGATKIASNLWEWTAVRGSSTDTVQ